MTSDNEIRRMSTEDVFEHRLQYFRENEDKFSPNQFKFLKSIQHYKMNIGVTKKQMESFISTVDSVMWNSHKK